MKRFVLSTKKSVLIFDSSGFAEFYHKVFALYERTCDSGLLRRFLRAEIQISNNSQSLEQGILSLVSWKEFDIF